MGDLETWGAESRAALRPGEELLALASVAVAYGNTSGAEPDFWSTPAGKLLKPLDQALDRAMPKGEPTGWAGKAALGAGALAFSSPSIDLPNDFPEQWIGGRTAFGPTGSLARVLQAAVDAEVFSFLAITRERLVLQHNQDGRFVEVWSLPRAKLVAARQRPRFLSRGRFGLAFDDGSWLVLGSHLRGGHAKQVVAALSG